MDINYTDKKLLCLKKNVLQNFTIASKGSVLLNQKNKPCIKKL